MFMISGMKLQGRHLSQSYFLNYTLTAKDYQKFVTMLLVTPVCQQLAKVPKLLTYFATIPKIVLKYFCVMQINLKV